MNVLLLYLFFVVITTDFEKIRRLYVEKPLLATEFCAAKLGNTSI